MECAAPALRAWAAVRLLPSRQEFQRAGWDLAHHRLPRGRGSLRLGQRLSCLSLPETWRMRELFPYFVKLPAVAECWSLGLIASKSITYLHMSFCTFEIVFLTLKIVQ